MDNNFNKSLLGLNIKHLRKLNKLTQGALCDIIEVKTTTLSNWEVGLSTPDLDLIVKLSNYFGINLNELILLPHNEWQIDQSQMNVASTVKCALCKSKDQTISAQEETIDLLKEKVESLKDKISSIQNNASNSGYQQTA